MDLIGEEKTHKTPDNTTAIGRFSNAAPNCARIKVCIETFTSRPDGGNITPELSIRHTLWPQLEAYRTIQEALEKFKKKKKMAIKR